MGEGLLIQRSWPDRATRHPHLTPPTELRSHLTQEGLKHDEKV